MHISVYEDGGSQLIFNRLIHQSEPAGPVRRDRSHIEDTLRLSAAEPSAEFSGEDAWTRARPASGDAGAGRAPLQQMRDEKKKIPWIVYNRAVNGKEKLCLCVAERKFWGGG